MLQNITKYYKVGDFCTEDSKVMRFREPENLSDNERSVHDKYFSKPQGAIVAQGQRKLPQDCKDWSPEISRTITTLKNLNVSAAAQH